ncbi:recombinase family protein [Sphingomonas sp. SRS2]|uniref:recombinase family protein n=1 Tax=Sphingomonas sp. SRS2 TaxID=133190 RepID=UPI002E16590C
MNLSESVTAEASPRPPVRAAQYVRMSTEHQKYSTENQAEIIAQYAARRGFEIVKTYEDSGKSGLRLDGRLSLQQLIADVRGGQTDFKAILVYDVSRWGRFQDADESAYYEFICREAGIAVQYCAEQFENDGSLSATIIKSMKRAMAGEYTPPRGTIATSRPIERCGHCIPMSWRRSSPISARPAAPCAATRSPTSCISMTSSRPRW